MRSNIKLFGLALIAALFAGAYFVINADSDPLKTGKLYQFSSSDSVRQIKIVNNYGAFTFSKDNDVWELTEPGNYRVNQQKMTVMEKFLLDMPINRILDSDLPEYGLTKPAVIIEFTTLKNIHKKLYIGNITPSKAQIYLKDDQSGRVFIVDAGSTTQFDGSLNAYRGKEIFSIDQNSISEVSYIKNGKKILTFKNFGPQNWQLTYPIAAPARKVEISEIIVKMRKWSAAGYPESGGINYADMGLKDPVDVLELTDSAGNSQRLEFGKTENAMIFVRTGSQEDIARLFSVDIDFSQFTVEKLVFVAPLQDTIQNIAELSITTAGQSYSFALDHTTDPIKIKLVDKQVPYEDFITFFVKFTNLSADGYDEVSTPGSVFLNLTTTSIDGSKKVLIIKERDEKSYYMEITGKTTYYVNKEEIDQLLYRLEAVTKSL